MSTKMRHALLIGMTMIALVFASVIVSYAETTNYIYDELNRLKRVEYEDGAKIEYTYDQAGNRSQVYVGKYTLTVNVVGSGTVTKNPDQPIYGAGTSVTLTAVNGSQTFSEWSGDLTGNTNPTTIVMDGNKSVTATFVTPGGWLQGWTYRKAVTLSRASGAVTNYQMRLLVGQTSGASGENVDCNGHVQADFDDLRFTTSDGATLLDYWIESITGTTPNQLATVWIEFDSIGTDATTFYMYYGNAGAAAASNITNTFIFADDFELGDFSRWTTAQSQWSVQSTTKKQGSYAAKGAGASSNRTLSKTITLTGTKRVRFWVNLSAAQGNDLYVLYAQGGGSRYAIVFGGSNSPGKVLYYDGAYKEFSPVLTCSSGTWRTVDILVNLPNNKYKVDLNGTVTSYVTTVFTTANITGQSLVASPTGGRNAYIDAFLIGNWADPEPSWGSWGAEQAN